MNEDLKEEKRDGEKKGFYSINLSESKIILIFVAFVFVIVTGIFGTLIVMSNMSKNENKKVKVEENDKKGDENLSDYNFYSELTGEEYVTVIDTTTDVALVTDSDQKSNQVEEKLSENVEDKKNENAAVLDDSEVIYSSKFDSDKKNEKIETKKEIKTSLKKTEPQKKENATKKETKKIKTTKNTKETIVKKNKVSTKKYVVQIGAFSNKKTADNILTFYQKGGYPIYIKEYTKDGKSYYRLRVGPFRDKNNAEKYLSSLKVSKYGKNSYISEVFN
ncbi:MAG TPA: SPOR domain-containing protein [Spirochaetota bacterium]|nr:SPOR domain-containing protein [Spirochaetota bacterium]